MNAGKRFEQNFHRSLKRLPGASMRILDGGRELKTRVWGDFLFWAADGTDYLFECKSTSQKSLPMAQVKGHQLESLANFELAREDMHAYLAVNFYDKDSDLTGRMWLVPIVDYLELADRMMNELQRESIPVKAFEALFPECPRVPGCMWDLGVLERIEHG